MDPESEAEINQPGDESADQDTLLNMVHEKRGVPPGTEVPRRPSRITHHEIKAMKATVQKEDSPFVAILRRIGGLFAGIFGIFAALIPSSSRKSDQRCDLNGHVYPKKWSGDFPKCSHCGVKITHPKKIHPDRER